MRNKNNIVLRILFACHAALLVISGAAQSLHLSVEKNSITFNENAVVTVKGEVKNLIGYVVLPEIEGFILTERSSTSFKKSNGIIKFSQSFTLQPIRPGDFTIGPAYVETGSRRVYSNSTDVHVEETSGSNAGNIVFLRCEPDKKEVYTGEMITLTLRLYHRADINFSGDRPYAHAFSGFWYQAGAVDGVYEDTIITMNGLKYVGETLYKEYVFPNSVGELYLPKYEYMCYVNFYGTDASSLSSDQQVELVSAPVKIISLQLPEHDSLNGYNGDVGVFSISSSLENETAKAWEPVTLTITITGQGNFPFMMAPELDLPVGLSAHITESTDSIITLRGTYEGQKRFTYLITPEKEGEYQLSGFKFTYFDPNKEEFVTLTTPGYDLHVEPGDKLTSETESNLPDSFFNSNSGSSNVFAIALILIIATGAFTFYYFNQKKKKQQNAIAAMLVKQKAEAEAEPEVPVDRSYENALALIHGATLYLNNGQPVQCVNSLYEALMIRICGLTKMRKEEISVNTLKYRLGLVKISPEAVAETMVLYEELKLKRYMMSRADIELAQLLLARTSALLSKLN